MVVRDTAANAVLFAKLNTMHEQEPLMQDKTGITPAGFLCSRFVVCVSLQHSPCLSSIVCCIDRLNTHLKAANPKRRSPRTNIASMQ
jgi:hypothetical protein